MMSNSLPAWARVMQKPLEMVAGRDLQPGDTLFFSARAWPRVLWTNLSPSSWSVLEDHGSHHKRATISISPDTYYVVKRADRPQAAPPPVTVPLPAPRPNEDAFKNHRHLNAVYVEGKDLAVGDVIYMDAIRKRAEIVHIGDMKMQPSGYVREAKLNFLDRKVVEPYLFSNFKINPPFRVIAGPKLDAAHLDPSLVVWRDGVSRWHWKGA